MIRHILNAAAERKKRREESEREREEKMWSAKVNCEVKSLHWLKCEKTQVTCANSKQKKTLKLRMRQRKI